MRLLFLVSLAIASSLVLPARSEGAARPITQVRRACYGLLVPHVPRTGEERRESALFAVAGERAAREKRFADAAKSFEESLRLGGETRRLVSALADASRRAGRAAQAAACTNLASRIPAERPPLVPPGVKLPSPARPLPAPPSPAGRSQ